MLESKIFFYGQLVNDLDKFSKLISQPQNYTAYIYTELYHDLLGTYFDEYYDLSETNRSKIDPK